MDTPIQFVPLSVALQKLEATDEADFIKTAKKHKCYYMRSGIVKIDLPKLQLAVDAEFAQALAGAAKRKTREQTPGRDLGLIEARLTLYPARIEAKKDKIKSAEAAVKAADSPYLRRKLDKELTTFRDQLAKLEEGNQHDLKHRDAILNSGTEEPVASQK